MTIRRSLFAALCLLGASATQAFATTWLVPGDGSNTCTSGAPNCATIADAVAAAVDADTVSITAPSTPVTAIVNVDKQLTISGAGIANTTVAVSAGVTGFDISDDGIVIQDLTISGGAIGVRFAVVSDDTDITRVSFSGQTVRGIEMSTGPATPITNVTITDSAIATVGGPSTAGLRMSSNATVTGLTITGTSFTGNQYGIYVANDGNASVLTNLTIDGCTFTNNSAYGIYAEEMRDSTIEDSTFTGGGTGVFVLKFYSSNGTPVSNLAFRRNQFSGFTGNAIGVQLLAMGLGTPGIIIEGNTITKNVASLTSTTALFVQLHPSQPNGQVDIVDNTITGTGTFGAGTALYAVRLRGNGPITFTGNTFDGGNVGGSATNPPSSGIWIESAIGSTVMPATTVISGSCNRIRGFHHGVSVYSTTAAAYGGLPAGATVSFENNVIEDNDQAQVANGATPTLDFENDWWGCVSGCDTTLGAVDSTPVLTSPPACVACAVDADCDDGLFCNGAETCNVGTSSCVASTDPCAGGGVCNDVCNEAADDCVVPDGTGCDDTQVCTIEDVCVAGLCVGDPNTCGDGTTQGTCGELCDDGNMTSGDGCSATCQPEFVCTPTPLVGCRTAESAKSQLQLKDKSPDTKDQSQWKYNKGAVTPVADFGNPTAVTNYQFCVYAGGALVSRAFIPAGGNCGTKPCWKANAKGFQYKDKEGTPDGITQLKLKEGLVPGKSQIQVKGKGENLDMPALPLAQPVRVQIRSSNGICWETTHSAPAAKNDSTQYKDKND